MKRANVARAAVLVEALKGLGRLTQACNLKKPDTGYERLGLEISVASIDPGSGSGGHADIEIDLETAKLLMPMVRRLILAELQEMGVKP